MSRFTSTEVIVIVILCSEKACTTKKLAEITGYSVRYIRNILLSLRKKGLVKSRTINQASFLGLPIPNQRPSQKEKIHVISTTLEKMWQNQGFQQQASELFDVSDFTKLKEKVTRIIKQRSNSSVYI